MNLVKGVSKVSLAGEDSNSSLFSSLFHDDGQGHFFKDVKRKTSKVPNSSGVPFYMYICRFLPLGVDCNYRIQDIIMITCGTRALVPFVSHGSTGRQRSGLCQKDVSNYCITNDRDRETSCQRAVSARSERRHLAAPPKSTAEAGVSPRLLTMVRVYLQ